MVTAARLAGIAQRGVRSPLLFSAEPVINAQAGGRRPRRRLPSPPPDVHERRPADPAALLSALPSRRHARADVAHDLRGSAAVGALHQDEGDQPRDAAVAHRPQHRRVPRGPVAQRSGSRAIAAWVDGGAPEGRREDAPAAKVFPPSTEWTYGEPDLIVRMEKGFKIPADGPDFIPEEHVDPKLTEDRYVKWVQIIPDAWRAVHHAHVYVDLPEGVDTDGLGLNMGSNVGNSMDLIEYGAGNDADIFPDGTREDPEEGIDLPLRGPLPPLRRRDVRPHARRDQVLSRRAWCPKRVVTSHRIRTGVGNDWVLNRERIEDLLLRAGHKIAIDEPSMPTGALIAENPLHAAAFLSIPPNSVVTHERYWPLPKPALIISFQPHMHFRGSKMLLEAIHPDGRREVLTSATHYEQNWQITYKYKTPHLFPAGTILHTVSIHDNTANNKHNPDPDGVDWLGQPDDGRDGTWVDGHRVPERRAVPGRACGAPGAAQDHHRFAQQQQQ